MYNKLLLNLTIVIGVLFFCEKLTAQVNLQTGSATFSLPMFNWQDPKSRLSDAISLNYNSKNGIKVNDVASNVGTGWDIMAGGLISRIQVGEPDDQKEFNGKNGGGYGDLSRYPNGYLYNSAPAGCPKAMKYYPIFENENNLYKEHNPVASDREQDYFAYTFNGKSGVFVLDKASFLSTGIYGKAVTLGDTKLIITFYTDAEALLSRSIRTTIKYFSIKDENGIIYTFEHQRLSKILRTHYCDRTQRTIVNQGNFESNGVYQSTDFDEIDNSENPYIINGWYLTKVTDPTSNNRKITLDYIDRNEVNNCGRGINLYSNPYNLNQQLISGGTQLLVATKRYFVIHNIRSIALVPELSKINYPNGYSVFFNYGKQRVDLNGDFVLSSIDFFCKNTLEYSYELNTTYFIKNAYGTPETIEDKSYARLCLKSIKKVHINRVVSDVHSFDYYLGTDDVENFVPRPYSFISDIFGYYNGNASSPVYNSSNAINYNIPINSNINDLSFDQLYYLCYKPGNLNKLWINPKDGYAKNGLLKTIKFPLGGVLNYYYEQNVANYDVSDQPVGGVHVSSTTSDALDGTNNIITNEYSYKLSQDKGGVSSLWGVEMPNNKMLSASNFTREEESKEWYANLQIVCLPCCSYKYKYPGIISQEQAMYNNSNELIKFITGALQLTSYALEGYVVYTLHKIHSKLFKGTVIGDVIMLVFDILVNYLSSCDNPERYIRTTVFTNSDLNLMNPLPVQFSRVEVSRVLHKNSTVNIGTTVYEFTNPEDYGLWNGKGMNKLFSMQQRAANWAYGLPKKTTYYDNVGKVKEVENEYEFDESYNKIKKEITTTSNQSCKCLVNRNYSLRNDTWDNPSFYNDNSAYLQSGNATSDISVQFYPAISGRVELKNTYERIYSISDRSKYVETNTHFDFGANSYQPNKITTTQSNGNKQVNENYYAEDFTSNDYKNLVDNNVLNVPVARYNSIIDKGTTIPKYLGASITEFTQTGLIKPLKLFSAKTKSPINFTFDKNVPKNFPNLKLAQSYSYDAQGLLVGITDEGNRQVTNIYDKEGMHVVATISNASPTIDNPLYTSFEETNSFNNWGVYASSGGAANFSYNSQSVTGKQALTLNSNYYLKGQITNSANKDYALTFWATSPLTVDIYTGTVKVKALNPESSTIPSVNGFQYYEYHITANMATVIQIAGNGNIDELRLLPTTAQMKTTSYDDVLGKISSCDENNRIMYYEYDVFHRLYMIKDEKKNVLKMYEYNTKE